MKWGHLFRLLYRYYIDDMIAYLYVCVCVIARF